MGEQHHLRLRRASVLVSAEEIQRTRSKPLSRSHSDDLRVDEGSDYHAGGDSLSVCQRAKNQLDSPDYVPQRTPGDIEDSRSAQHSQLFEVCGLGDCMATEAF